MSKSKYRRIIFLQLRLQIKLLDEMKERVEKLIGERGKDVWISTFHSMCVRIFEDVGY